MMTAHLEIEDVGVRANGRWLVRGVSVAVSRGEVLAIIGPNGAGKTTLLEAVVKLQPPTEGVIRVEGRPVTSLREAAREFAFLPDAARLPPEATVRTVVDDALRRATHPPAPELARVIGVEQLLDAPLGQLSRGESQRVALFCTLALGRRIVVLDEPLAPFDPLQLRAVIAAIRRVADTGTTVVTSIHQLSDAQKLAQRFLLLSEGRAIACGDLSTLQTRAKQPADSSLEDVFVALLSKDRDAA
jgi:ABC-type multidrug transport system ATPase subunit